MKVTINRLRGSNALAFGDFDFLFDEHTVYQLIGKNGSGKSSLASILEEVLYNKNTRGFSKSEMVNRYSDEKSWWGEVTFSKDSDLYILHKEVKSTAKVKLTKNGEDISGHTATQTYKIVQDILGGMDFKTFSKLVYQSIESSMDFLTATDANRKKFLVSLLGLEVYSEVESELKEHYKAAKTELDRINGQTEIIEKWLKQNSDIPNELHEVTVPTLDFGLETELSMKQADLFSIEKDNKEVQAHNKRVEEATARLKKKKELQQDFEKLQRNVEDLKKNLPAPAEDKSEEIQSVTRDLASVESTMAGHKKNYQKFKKEADNTQCPTCGSHLDVSQQAIARDAARDAFEALKPERELFKDSLGKLQEAQKAFAELSKATSKLNLAEVAYNQFEVPDNIPDIKHKTDASLLIEEIESIRGRISKCKTDIKNAERHNVEVEVNNAKREQSIKQHNKYVDELALLCDNLTEVQNAVDEISILVKAFGNRGLIGYKIESNVKVFEDLINKYLSVFTSGKFALSFELNETKLQVVIYADGTQVTMHSLSSGERSKVNVSTLLAIRNLMSIVSNVELNLLFLDEVISVLDPNAMDTLIDILLEEHQLNTFLVSHGYNHPLTHSIQLENVDGISKVINGG